MSHGEAPLKIFVFGSVNVDVSARMAALPRPGQTVNASGYGIGLGGKGANQAVAVAKLGGASDLSARSAMMPLANWP